MGSGGKKKQDPVPQQVTAPVFSNTLGTSGIGYGWTPNTYTEQGRPQWMQGYFADPSWGRAAADPTVQLTHEMLGPKGINATNQAIYDNAPEGLRGNIQPVQQQGGMPAGAIPPSMNPKSALRRKIPDSMMTDLQMIGQNQALPEYLRMRIPTSGQGG